MKLAVYTVIDVYFKTIIYLVAANVCHRSMSRMPLAVLDTSYGVVVGIGRVHTATFIRRTYRSRTVRVQFTLRPLRRVRPVHSDLIVRRLRDMIVHFGLKAPKLAHL